MLRLALVSGSLAVLARCAPAPAEPDYFADLLARVSALEARLGAPSAAAAADDDATTLYSRPPADWSSLLPPLSAFRPPPCADGSRGVTAAAMLAAGGGASALAAPPRAAFLASACGVWAFEPASGRLLASWVVPPDTAAPSALQAQPAGLNATLLVLGHADGRLQRLLFSEGPLGGPAAYALELLPGDQPQHRPGSVSVLEAADSQQSRPPLAPRHLLLARAGGHGLELVDAIGVTLAAAGGGGGGCGDAVLAARLVNAGGTSGRAALFLTASGHLCSAVLSSPPAAAGAPSPSPPPSPAAYARCAGLGEGETFAAAVFDASPARAWALSASAPPRLLRLQLAAWGGERTVCSVAATAALPGAWAAAPAAGGAAIVALQEGRLVVAVRSGRGGGEAHVFDVAPIARGRAQPAGPPPPPRLILSRSVDELRSMLGLAGAAASDRECQAGTPPPFLAAASRGGAALLLSLGDGAVALYTPAPGARAGGGARGGRGGGEAAAAGGGGGGLTRSPAALMLLVGGVTYFMRRQQGSSEAGAGAPPSAVERAAFDRILREAGLAGGGPGRGAPAGCGRWDDPQETLRALGRGGGLRAPGLASKFG